MSTQLSRTVVWTLLCALLLLAATACLPGQEAKYPNKPIDLIVASKPGAGGDVAGRFIAGVATKKLGVPVNVVNVEGASGVTGMLQALKAAPDGYTLLLDSAANSSYLYSVRTDIPMPLEERTYVAQVVSDYHSVLVNNDTGWKTLQEMIDFIKTKPEEFKWGAGQLGSNPMFAELDLFTAAGIDTATLKKTKMVVFSNGNSGSLQAVNTGDVQMAVSQQGSLQAQLSTGRVHTLATLSPVRLKYFPDIPTAKELGITGLTGRGAWYGIAGPKGLPDSIVKVWNDMLSEAIKDPEVQADAEKAKSIIAYAPAAEFKDSVLKQYESGSKIATDLGFRR